MKKAALIALLTAGLFSCNSTSDKGKNNIVEKDTTAPNTPGILNANGNLPDTTNSMTIDKSGKDTTSAHVKP